MAIPRQALNLTRIEALLSSLLSDFFIRFQVTSKVTEAVVGPFLVDIEETKELKQAEFELKKRGSADFRQAFFEGMILRHYTKGNQDLLTHLVDAIECSFTALKASRPGFFHELRSVLELKGA